MPKSRSVHHAARGSPTRIVVVIAMLPLVSGCKGEFMGPYPCEPGYESCVNPERNFCETDVTSSAAYCGSCDKACEVGALCVDSQCQVAPLKLATLDSTTTPAIAVSNTGVYWPSAYQNEILGVSLTGGTPNTIASNVSMCGGSSLAFVMADNSLYYWSNGTMCGSSNCSGLMNLPLPSGTPSQVAQISGSNGVCPMGMALDRTRVYWVVTNQNNSSSIMSASRTDGSITALANFQAKVNSGIAITDKQILFGSSDNGPTVLEAVPISGTSNSPTKVTTTLGGKSYGFSMFVANNEFVFLASGGCPCNGNDTQGVLPTGTIDRFPVQGGEGVNIARFSGFVNSVVLDSTSVYWATDSTVWRVPINGGAAVRIADNLAPNTTPFICDNSCGAPNTSTLSIAVDSQYVYIADTSSNVNAIFKAKK